MADSLSTITDAILDNADYADNGGSMTKARAFETAVVRYMFAQPMMAADQGSSLQMDMFSPRTELARVRAWIAANTTAAGSSAVRYFGFSSGSRRS